MLHHMNTSTRTKAKDFLNTHHLGVLSTVSDSNEPWGSAIYFALDDDLNCYFVTREDTRKFHNIDEQPLVAMTVVDETEQTTVQLQGKISKVPAADIMEVVFHKLENLKPKGAKNWQPPVLKVHKGDYMVLRITPSKMQYANYRQEKTDANSSYIEEVELA